MKKLVLLVIMFTFINVFSQDLDFVKNYSLKGKIYNVLTFIEKSPTIRDNYWDSNFFILTDGNEAMTFVIETNIYKIYKENRCIKLNDRVTWVINDLNELDDNYIDKDKINKISDCSHIVNKEKSKEMLNSVFNFNKDKYGFYFLGSLVTFDRLLYLDIEFREATDDDEN